MSGEVLSGVFGQRLNMEIAGIGPEWLADLRALLTGSHNGSVVDAGAVVEVERQSGRLVALWDLGMTGSLAVPQRDAVPAEPTAEQAAAALRYINRHRARCAQRPLDPVASGWTERDLVIEAERLGWDGEE